MNNEQEATHFVWLFLAIIGVLAVVIALMPKEGIPERSKYIAKGEEEEVLQQGKVILMFFFNPESKLSRQQAELVLDIDKTYDWLVVEWFNTKQELSDKRTKEEMKNRNVTAIPYFVIKNRNSEVSHLGFLPRVELEDLVIGMKPRS